jgi:hypothetical protein
MAGGPRRIPGIQVMLATSMATAASADPSATGEESILAPGARSEVGPASLKRVDASPSAVCTGILIFVMVSSVVAIAVEESLRDRSLHRQGRKSYVERTIGLTINAVPPPGS